MEEFLKKCVDMGATVGGKIVFAIVVLVVGSLIIKLIRKGLTKADRFTKLDKTVQSFRWPPSPRASPPAASPSASRCRARSATSPAG